MNGHEYPKTLNRCKISDLLTEPAGVLYVWWYYRNKKCPQHSDWRDVAASVNGPDFNDRLTKALALSSAQRKGPVADAFKNLRGDVTAFMSVVTNRGPTAEEREGLEQMGGTLKHIKKLLPDVAQHNVFSLVEYTVRRRRIFNRDVMLRDSSDPTVIKRAVRQVQRFAARVQRLQYEFPRELERFFIPPDPEKERMMRDYVFPMPRAVYPTLSTPGAYPTALGVRPKDDDND